MPWYNDYSSYWDWTCWHDTNNYRKKLKSEVNRKEWNNKTKLPRITKFRKGCWL